MVSRGRHFRNTRILRGTDAEGGQVTTQDRPENGAASAERLTFFSDAVVAIAMTLLALELPVPEGLTNHEALHSLREHAMEYWAFFISFAVVAVHWSGHHRLFGHLTGLGGRLLRWNLLWLLTIVLMPFATRTLTGDGAFQVRFITYAAVQALAGTFFLLMVREISRHHLLRPDAPPEVVPASYARLFVMTSAFLVSIPVSLVTRWAYLCWIAIPFVSRGYVILARRRAHR
jgi:uncharacterized membrane protein